MIDYIWRVNDLDVYYTNQTNGGGDYFAIEYIQIVEQWYGKVDHILEWCSGPGFIGFGLFGHDLCSKISFNEMFDPAVDMLYKTKNNSKKCNSISIYHHNSLDVIPNTEKFDLVVGNPPHWDSIESAQPCFPFDIKEHYHIPEILIDPNWKAHKNFFQNVKYFLSKDGKILLQENKKGSHPDIFESMIDNAGLKITGVAESQMYDMIYYLEVGHK